MKRGERNDGSNTAPPIDTAPHSDSKHTDAGELFGLFSQPPMLVAGTHAAPCKHSNCCHKQPSCSCQGNWHNRSFQSQPSLQRSLTPFGQVTMGTLHGSHHPDITHKPNEMPSQLCAHTQVYICLFPPRLEQFLLPFYGSLKQQGPCSEGQGC